MYLSVYGDTCYAVVTAAALASTGHQVTLCLPEGWTAEQLLAAQMPFEEQGLADLVEEQKNTGRLQLECWPAYPDDRVSAVFLALAPDALDLALQVVDNLAIRNDSPWLVVNQASFPVGTSEILRQRLQAASSEHHRELVCMPDILQEGVALQGFMRPVQILLGCESEWAELQVREIVRPFNRLRDQLRIMGLREVEFTRLAITGMLATRLGFINDMALLADQLDVDIELVRQGMGADPRIGDSYLYPGCGFGGLNFSRSVMALADTLEQSGVGSELLDEVLRINERQKEILFRKLWRHYEAQLQGRHVALWGVAFKPGTNRIDNAPALKLLEALWAQNVTVHVHDPRALPVLHEHYGDRPDLIYHDDPYKAVDGCDALLVVTEWKDYWSPDFTYLRNAMNQTVLLDGRNIYNPAFVREQGFVYYGVGRS